MFTKSRLAVAIMAVSSGLTSTVVLAEDVSSGGVTLLDRTVVSATRTEQNVSDVSSTIESVSSKDIDQTHAKNLYDAVQYTPGVEATTSGRFGISGFNIRGMEGDRIKIVVDGVQQATPFNPGGSSGSATQAIYPNAIEVDTLSSIEINKGPSSTLYGSDAMGGAVVLKTKDPSDVLKTDGDENRFGIKSSYFSSDEQIKNTLTWAMRSGKLETLVMGTYARGSELETYGDGADIEGSGRGIENPADTDLANILAKAYYQLNDTNKVGVVLERYKHIYDESSLSGNYTLMFGPNPGITYADARSKDETIRTRYGLNYEFTESNVLFDSMNLALNYQITETTNENFSNITDHSGYVGYDGNRTRLRQAEDKSIQLDGQFDKIIQTENVTHELTYGLNYVDTDFKLTNIDIFHDNGTSKPGSTTVPDATVTQWGLFVQDNAFLLNETLVLTSGLRYNSFEATPSSDEGFTTTRNKNSNDAWTGKLGAVYHLNDNLSTFAQISQGFKAPSVEQLYYEYDSGADFIPNSNLKAETSTAYEIGLRGQNNFAQFELVGFINKYKDFIDSEELEKIDPNRDRYTIVKPG